MHLTYTRICQIFYFYDNVHLHKYIKYISRIEIFNHKCKYFIIKVHLALPILNIL